MIRHITYDDTQLKLCPFCGCAPAFKHKAGSYGYFPGAYQVSCACGAASPFYDDEEWTPEKGTVGVSDKAKKLAAEWWNRRAAPTPPATQIDDRPSNFENAFSEARDVILYGRNQLEAVLDSDQTNAVLSVIDEMYDAAWQARAVLASQPAQVDEDRRDAERYRAIRDTNLAMNIEGIIFRAENSQEVDEEVDAAMSANKE